jgi:DNA repair exonuclease SbcCD nuclease subunit
MRILHLTDTHLGAHLSVVGAPAGWHRGDDHARAVEHALAPALRGEVDVVLHTGDVFDRSRPSPRAMRDAARLFSAAADHVPVVMLPGNHDRRGIRRSLPLDHPNLHVFDRPTRFVVGELALGLVPFFRRAEHWAAAARSVCDPGVDLLLTHMAFDGASVPGLTFRADRRTDTVGRRHLPAGVRTILCGHIHPRQVTRIDGVRVIQPGATERTAFSEADQPKGALRMEWGRCLKWRWQDGPSRPMVTLREPAAVRPGTLLRNETGVPDEVWVERGAWVLRRAAARAPRPARRQVPLFA